MERIKQIITDSVSVKNTLLHNEKTLVVIREVADAISRCFKQDGKVLLCGNGGSAADAQHIAAELSGRFILDRRPLFAEALHTNSSYLTAVANDYSYDEVFSRIVEAMGRRGDILIGISTSGNSKNICNGLEKANSIDMVTIGLVGGNGGKMADKCKYLIPVPSNVAPRIQETHIMIGHIICELVESHLFGSEN